MKTSILFVVLASCASLSSVLGKQCGKRALKEENISFVNLKTIKTDGTAVAFIENGGCPVKIADSDATFDEEDRHHQTYKLALSGGEKCLIEGWDVGPTTMKCLKSGQDDSFERFYVDHGYKSQPCPKGCDAECKAIDPDWNQNALKMFGFKWQEKPKEAKPKESVTLTETVKASATGKIRRSVPLRVGTQSGR